VTDAALQTLCGSCVEASTAAARAAWWAGFDHQLAA
jgi:hypothetical protein